MFLCKPLSKDDVVYDYEHAIAIFSTGTFDFFYKNSSSVKVGTENFVDIEWFHSLFDKSVPKFYLER